jgi:hypothetical protein
VGAVTDGVLLSIGTFVHIFNRAFLVMYNIKLMYDLLGIDAMQIH